MTMLGMITSLSVNVMRTSHRYYVFDFQFVFIGFDFNLFAEGLRAYNGEVKEGWVNWKGVGERMRLFEVYLTGNE